MRKQESKVNKQENGEESFITAKSCIMCNQKRKIGVRKDANGNSTVKNTNGRSGCDGTNKNCFCYSIRVCILHEKVHLFHKISSIFTNY